MSLTIMWWSPFVKSRDLSLKLCYLVIDLRLMTGHDSDEIPHGAEPLKAIF